MKRAITFITFFVLIGTGIRAFSSSLNSLSLDDAIRLALEKNVSIKYYYDSYEMSKLGLDLEKSEFDVKLIPDVSFSFEDGSQHVQTYGLSVEKKAIYGTTFGASVGTDIYEDSSDKYTSTASLYITQPLVKGAGEVYNTASLLGAIESKSQNERSLLLAKQELIISCVSSYYSIVEYQMLREAYKKNYDRSEELLKQANIKLELGTVSKMDVYRAEIAMLQAKNNLITYDETISNALDNFKLLLGLSLDEEVALVDGGYDYYKEIIPLDEALEMAISSRLELATYGEQITAYERNLHISRRNLYPPLDLNVSASFYGSGDAFRESVGMEDDYWNVSLSSSFDIERKSEKVSYLNSLISLNRAKRELKLYEDQIRIEVKVNYRNVTQNYERISLQKRFVEESEKQLEFTLMRYSNGEIDNLGVIEAEENVIQAKIQYYSAITNYVVSLYKFRKSIGGLAASEYEKD